MSRIILEVGKNMIDDFASEAGAGAVENFSLRWAEKIGGALHLGRKKSRHYLTRDLRFPKFMQNLAASYPAQAVKALINHPLSRFLMTAGGIVGITFAVGFGPMVALSAIVSSYVIKLGSSYIMAGLRHGWSCLTGRHRPAPRQVVEKNPGFKAKCKHIAAHLVEAAFETRQKNVYLNMFSIAATITGASLLLPAMAEFSHWLGGLLSMRSASLIGRNTQPLALASISERTVAERAAASVLRPEAISERVYTITSQGTARILTGRIAGKYGLSGTSFEPPTRMAAALALSSILGFGTATAKPDALAFAQNQALQRSL